jgi:hypothetical protein
MWICRDEGASHCRLFEGKPVCVKNSWSRRRVWNSYYSDGTLRIIDGLMLHADKFQEVTFENSPVEVELTLPEKKVILCGGRSSGKMMQLEKWLQQLPPEIRENITIVRASDGPQINKARDEEFETPRK